MFRCNDCESTASAWKQLQDDWIDHPIGFVAEVFCDDENGICDFYEVTSYPSLYFGDPESPELYHGELDYDSLVAFADKNLRTLPCSVKNLDVCNDKIRKTVEKLRRKSIAELEAMEREILKYVDEEQKRFDNAALKLQKQYTELANNFNTKVDKLREDSSFKWIQQVLNEQYEDHEKDSGLKPQNDEL